MTALEFQRKSTPVRCPVKGVQINDSKAVLAILRTQEG